jgi:hypothetical protein
LPSHLLILLLVVVATARASLTTPLSKKWESVRQASRVLAMATQSNKS